MVISTYVEMILFQSFAYWHYRSDLHVCGDDPIATAYILPLLPVISTYVEMILSATSE